MFFDIIPRDDFLDMSPQAGVRKTKINKWDYIKQKSFCTAKETINKTKRQPTVWEKIFANNTFYKRLISQLYKEIIQLNIKKEQTIQFKIVQRTCIDISPKDKKIANKPVKRCSAPLIIRKMQIKPTVRYHLTPVRIAIIKKTRNNKYWPGGCGEKGTLVHCCWE